MSTHLFLFGADIRHCYFEESKSPPLRYVPADVSRRLMHNTGMVMKVSEDGFDVFIEKEKIDLIKILSRDAETPPVLHVKAYAEDPCIANYTDIGGLKHDEILHFAGEDPNGGRLTARETVCDEDFRKVKDPVMQQVLSRSDRTSPPLFIVSIRIFPPENADETKSADFSSRRYFARFESRSVYWKYILTETSRPKNLDIKDLDNSVTFDRVEAEISKSKQVFMSRSAVKLTARSTRRFQLTDGGKVLVKRLPVASAKQINREYVDGHTVWVSEIYFTR